MKGLLLVLFWPDAVWRHLRDAPLAPGRLIFRLALPLALVGAFALQIGTGRFHVDSARFDAPLAPVPAPMIFATWLGAVLAMAFAFTLLAPGCKGRSDFTRSLNLAFFGLAPIWLAALASAAGNPSGSSSTAFNSFRRLRNALVSTSCTPLSSFDARAAATPAAWPRSMYWGSMRTVL